MKKTYMQPTTLLVKVAIAKMICTSPDVTVNTSGNVDAGSVDSRRGGLNVWDEE